MKKKYSSPYELDGRLPLKTAIPLGMQHVLAMFIGNLTAPIVILGVCGVASGSPIHVTILSNAMFIAGIVTLFQLYPVWKVGAKLPIVMGTDAGVLGIYISVLTLLGGGFDSYGVLLGACIIGGFVEVIIGCFYKYVEKLFPPVVIGVVLTAIGISLIPVGVNTFCGGDGALDFGSTANLFLAGLVLASALIFQFVFKGFISNISLLLAIAVGYIAAIIMNLTMPHTFMTTDASGAAVEATKSWVMNWSAVGDAAWFALPKFLPVKLGFDIRAIVPVCFMFVAMTMNTMACVSALTKIALGRKITHREVTGALNCDGLGSSLAAIFGVLPNTAFTQNIGMVNMTRIVNRYSVLMGAIFLILCGFCPKLMSVISIMPPAVLGGVVCYMFGTILVGGIELLGDEGFGPRNTTIIAVSIGVAFALGNREGSMVGLPSWFTSLFASSGVAFAAFSALVLNLILPKEKKGQKQAQQPTTEAIADEAAALSGDTAAAITPEAIPTEA